MDALVEQKLLDLHIVFDDTVVDQGNIAGLRDMGMGVDVRGLTVGGPTGVSDAHGSLHVRAAVEHIREHLNPALGLFHLKALLLGPHRHTGGVIAPVLHPKQSLQQNGCSLFLPHITDYSAHNNQSS